MRKPLLALAALFLALVIAVPAVVAPLFPVTLPASTVWGRLGIGPGPGQAIPFGTLFANLFNGGSAPTAHGILIGEGTAPLNSVVCPDAQIPVGQTSADPACKALSGDVAIVDTGAATIQPGVVTGGGTKIATNTITHADEAKANANTMVGNWTASSANQTNNAMPSCGDTGGNHLNYVSGTGITCGSSGPGGSRVLLNTLTASNSPTVSDTSSLTVSFDQYEIVFEHVIPATTETILELQVHSGGSFQSTGYLSSVMSFNSSGVANGTATGFVSLNFPTAANANNANNGAPGYSGSIRVYQPSLTAASFWIGNMGWVNNAGGAAIATVNGFWNSASPIDGFQVLFSSGNITSGTVKIYGLN